MNRIVVALALTTACFVWDASSAHAMSCRNRLVNVGDPMVRVQDLCGEPASVTERVVHRTRHVRRYISAGVVVVDAITVSAIVTVWLYDFGPSRFMRELVFEEGRLAVIETLRYGTPQGRVVSLEPSPRVPIARPTPANRREPSSPA
jgi:hypothetical protein